MPRKTTTTSKEHHDRHGHGLACGDGAYGADSLNEKMKWAHGLFILEDRGMPNGWILSAVLMTPFTDDELAPILGELVAWKERDRWLDETYHERVATLVLWIAEQPWSWSDRCGAAWAAMWFGMEAHGFRPVVGHHDALRWPGPHFFEAFLVTENSVAEFAAFLRGAYVHPDDPSRRQGWQRVLTARRRQKVEKHLQSVLDRPQLRRHRVVDLSGSARVQGVARHGHRASRKVIRQRAAQR